MRISHSIVVVSWECGDHLARLIASMNKWLARETELVLIDNSSQDLPHRRLPQWKGLVRYRQCEENLGFGAAVNHGVALARGKAVTVLNPDTELLDSSLEDLAIHAFETRTICGPRVLDDNGRPEPSASGPEVGAWPWIRALTPGALNPPLLQIRTEPWRLNRSQKVAWLTGACISARRVDLLDLGPFSPEFHMYGEDMDLGLRASAAGIDSVFCPDIARIVHHGRGSSEQRYPDGPWGQIVENRRRALRRAYGERAEAAAWRAYRLNLWLRARSKPLVGLDPAIERAYENAIDGSAPPVN